MHILLINTNPVVSKLFKLSLKGNKNTLTEMSSIENVEEDKYALIFIDESLCKKRTRELFKRFNFTKKVCISYDLEAVKGFDATLQKPFLPSQVIDIIELQQPFILDVDKIDEIKYLLDMSHPSQIETLNKKSKKYLKKAINLAIANLSEEEIKKFFKGKEIHIAIQLEKESL